MVRARKNDEGIRDSGLGIGKNEEPDPAPLPNPQSLIPNPSFLPRVFASPHRCPTCGSTEHTGYEGTQSHTLDYPGIAPDGQPYTRKVWRYTTCATPGCGQKRVDCFFEFNPVAWDSHGTSPAADLRADEVDEALDGEGLGIGPG
jgi:hypothetical protein